MKNDVGVEDRRIEAKGPAWPFLAAYLDTARILRQENEQELEKQKEAGNGKEM